jgi:PAS domain S-box-containing protein
MESQRPPLPEGDEASAKPGRRRREHFFPVLLAGSLLLVVLAITLVTWANARKSVYQDLQTEFDFRVRETAERLEQRMATYEEVLRSTQGFMRGSIYVDPNDFREFVANLALPEHFPGIQGIAVSTLLSPGGLTEHVTGMQREGHATYRVNPGGNRDRFSAITRIEPLAGMNLRALGFDMLTEPFRRAAMIQAGESGRPAMSGKVQLIQESGREAQAGFVMYLPVYRHGVPIETLAERQAALLGWVAAPFRINDLMAGIGGERSNDLRVRVFDGTALDPQSLMYDSHRNALPPETGPAYRSVRRTAVSGRLWTMEIASRPDFEARVGTEKLVAIGLTGTIAGLLLSVLVWMLATGRRRALSLAVDMTRKLRASEFRWKYALEGAGEGVWDLNLQTEEVLFSRRWKAMLGYSDQEIPPRRSAWADRIHPDDKAAVLQAAEACIAGATKTFACEYRMLCKDGSWKWVLARGMVVNRGSDGTALRMIGTHSDITDRKDAERREAQRMETLDHTRAALAHAQRLEAVGKLTGGVAHDFNNTLQIISGNLQLLQASDGAREHRQRLVSSALDAVERGAKLSSQLLAFARRQPLQPVVVKLNRMLDNMADLMQRALGESIEIRRETRSGLWNTLVDPSRLENVILNLALNARDAMDGGGILDIRLRNAEFVGESAGPLDGSADSIPAGQYVLVAMSDTGSGMSREVLEQAFEPFFTTKEEGKGTGLGLSMAHGFVRQSGGHIRIDSTVGHGTTVSIYLPRSLEPEARVEPARTEAYTEGGNETLLVVEDDDDVRETVVALLTNLGYRVMAASDGEAALAILKGGEPIDLLFTDVVMPGPVSSRELARRAKEIHPGIEVLFTSGYTRNAVMQDGKLEPGVNLLGKPYRSEQLARRLRELLAKARHSRQLGLSRPEQRAAGSGDDSDPSGASPQVSPAGAPAAAITAVSTVATPFSTDAFAATSDVAAQLGAPSATAINRSCETRRKVLVVDDNTDLLELACEMLSMLGWAPTPCTDAERALQLLRDQSYEVLFTDVCLPGTNGIALARQAGLLRPGIRVVFASGYGDLTEHGGDRAQAFLRKPYNVTELLQALEAA